MTRILALGDTQIGVQTVTLESQAQVLDRIAGAAIEHRVDFVLHGGDVFEGRGPHGNVITPEELAVFRSFVARLREAGVPTLAITGNGSHDAAMRDINGLAIFEDIPGIRISSRPEVVVMAEAVIVTLPWVSPARLIAQTNGTVDRDAVMARTAELLIDIARDLHEAEFIYQHPDHPVILLAHWSISGASLPTGLPVDQLREPVLEWADLDALGFDCVIASHIHKAQRLDNPDLGDKTVGVYTGSPQPLNHGEAGYEHGVWIVDIEQGKVSTEFLPIESPQFVTLDLDEEWRALLGEGVQRGEMIEWVPMNDAIVRVRYTATREQDATIDKDAIRRELLAAGASRVTIEPTIIREVRARVETMTQELGPLEALGMYADAQGLDDATKGRMVERLGEWIA